MKLGWGREGFSFYHDTKDYRYRQQPNTIMNGEGIDREELKRVRDRCAPTIYNRSTRRNTFILKKANIVGLNDYFTDIAERRKDNICYICGMPASDSPQVSPFPPAFQKKGEKKVESR